MSRTGLLSIRSTVNENDPADGLHLLTLGSMVDVKDAETPSDFAGRLRLAIADEKRSQTRTERESGLPQGYITRLLGTSPKAKQIFSPGPDVVTKLANYLNVSYEWLAIGRGPMRVEGYAPSALEEAVSFAMRHGARRDAIDAAAKRFRDVANMTGTDWIIAFNQEAIRLDRDGIPRPEVIEAKQKKTRRLAAKKKRQEAPASELPTPVSKRQRKGR